MTWYMVHMGTGTVVDVRDGVRLVDWDTLPDEARELFDSGHDSDVTHVARVYGVGVEVFTESGYLEVRTENRNRCDACERMVDEPLQRCGSFDICSECADCELITEMLAD